MRGKGENNLGEVRVDGVQCHRQAYCLLRLSTPRLRDVTKDCEFFPKGRVGSFFHWNGPRLQGAAFCATDLEG